MKYLQACQLTKSIVRPGLPLLPTLSQQISETKVREAIMHAHHYDGTLEKLPRRRDPVIFWRAVERGKIGITEQRAKCVDLLFYYKSFVVQIFYNIWCVCV